MAIIKIFIEGGVLEHQNISSQTYNNSSRLRECFYKLLTQYFNPNDFSLQVEIGGPKNQAIKFFKSEIEKNLNVYLLIDLDANSSKRTEIVNSFNLRDKIHEKNIFFMVQEMEAWILSQPDKIEACYKNLKRKKIGKNLGDDNLLLNVNPELIVKPSVILETILGRYFTIEKRN